MGSISDWCFSVPRVGVWETAARCSTYWLHNVDEEVDSMTSLKHSLTHRTLRDLTWPTWPKSHQSCPTLCDPRDRWQPTRLPHPWDSPDIGFKMLWTNLCVCVCVSCSVMSYSLWPLEQAPLSTGFSRQEYWSGSPFPSPGDLPNPGIEPSCLVLQADSLPSEPPGKPQIKGPWYTGQESNPGLPHGRWEFYHWTTNAPINIAFKIL